MDRKEKMDNLLKELSAEFLGRESDGSSLISVTRADVSPDFKRATVYITVLPDSMEEKALNFAKRQGGAMRSFLKGKLDTKNTPFLDIKIDLGEKHRQKIDELLRNG